MEIAQKARFEPDAAKYEEDGLKLNAIHFSELPQIPLWQPAQDAVMATSVEGCTFINSIARSIIATSIASNR